MNSLYFFNSLVIVFVAINVLSFPIHMITNALLVEIKSSRNHYPYIRNSHAQNQIFMEKVENKNTQDISESYSIIDKILFSRFSSSVATELKSSSPKTYKNLIDDIHSMILSESSSEIATIKGTNILVRLFPPGLLPAYKLIFSPFPNFSAWMNTWVTHWATSWLMGPSKVYDIEISQQFESNNSVLAYSNKQTIILEQQGLLVEKCTFLETCGCIRTCTYACKIPTQRFFNDYMGLPVTLKPNFTDYSCKFEFGIKPVIDIEDDDVFTHPCLSICTHSINGRKEPISNCLSEIN